jgi:hypothetical protein
MKPLDCHRLDAAWRQAMEYVTILNNGGFPNQPGAFAIHISSGLSEL